MYERSVAFAGKVSSAWTGIAGDKWYKNGPFFRFDLVDNPWLSKNIRENHGPLGENYLPFDYIMEGDTPSFFGLINNGLGWHASPSYESPDDAELRFTMPELKNGQELHIILEVKYSGVPSLYSYRRIILSH